MARRATSVARSVLKYVSTAGGAATQQFAKKTSKRR